MSKLIALALLAAACGGNKQPPPAETSAPAPAAPAAPAESAPMTPEDCAAKGGLVKGDIGDGKVACDQGQRELGRVKQGIEGAICCASATTP